MEFRENGVLAAGLEDDVSEVGKYELLDGNSRLKITDTTGESPSVEILSVAWDGGKLILNSDEDDSMVLFRIEVPDGE